jgi:2-methylcitrate dehydratase PrpD
MTGPSSKELNLHGEDTVSTVTRELARFATMTRYEDLPDEAVLEVKRILLDCIGCGLAGLPTHKGKVAVKMAEKLGAGTSATILGLGKESSPFGAAFANAELINALDYEVLCGGHVPALILSSSLAAAEERRSSGKELLLASAIGHEIASRTGTGLSVAQSEHPPAPGLPSIAGWNYAALGGTAGVGILLHLSQEKMTHALGIAGYMVPAQAVKKFATTLPISRVKYAPVGWINQVELTAAFLAQMGQTGDTTVLDGQFGFWKYMGSSAWEPALVTGKLGKMWHFPEQTIYKRYPCCGVFSGALDCLKDLIHEHALRAEDIEGVRVFLDPRCEEPVWRNNNITNEMDAQFSVSYNMALMANGIDLGAWQHPETYNDKKILKFMRRVTFSPHPHYDQIVREDPKARPNRVEVKVGEKTYVSEKMGPRGASLREETRITDEELLDKFRQNAGPVLSAAKMNRAAEMILALENVENISELMDLFSS